MIKSVVARKSKLKSIVGFGSVMLRGILGLVFVVSGVAKMWDVYGFSETVRSYNLLPESLIVFVSALIPLVEFTLGVMLVLNYLPRFTTFALIGMVLVFTFLTYVRYRSGDISDCGCYGKLLQRSIDGMYFIQNGVILLGLLMNSISPQKGGFVQRITTNNKEE